MFVVCGEALFDFFLATEDGPASVGFAAHAGGSPFNVAIGLARLDQRSALLTGISTDMLGERLRLVLESEGVSTDYAIATDRPTTISLVGLDTHGVPAYQFYDAGSADTGVVEADLPALRPEVTGIHFGSYSIVAQPVADAFAALAKAESGRFISLDPNIRPTVEPDMDKWRRRIDALTEHAHFVKVSAEDLEIVYPGRSRDAVAEEWIGHGVRLVVVTDGGSTAQAWTAGGLTSRASPPKVRVIDTVGAGDTFQAAMLAQLHAAPGGPREAIDDLDQSTLDAMIDYAARAAAITCSRRGADLPRTADLVT